MINTYFLSRIINLKFSNFKKLRFTYYILFSILYFIFMSKNSYLGVDWINYHKEWVLNATNNIINGFEGLKYGLTSRDNIKLLGDMKSEQVYVVQAYQYIHLTLFSILSNGKLTIFLGQLVDKIIICLTAILTGEIAHILFSSKKQLVKNIIAICSFSFFLSSPWVYRMILDPWQEVYFLFFLLGALFAIYKKYYKIGTILYICASFSQYQWSIILSFIYLLSFLTTLVFPERKNLIKILPEGFRNRKYGALFIIVGIAPTIYIFLQKIIINLASTEVIFGGSSLLYRVGINSYSNHHHGGWLASFQFLGGNRLSNCLSNNAFNEILTNLDSKIYFANCIFSILGMIIISLISIIGYVKLIQNEIKYNWLLIPIFLSFFILAMFLQQSIAVHLQGYSFIFAFIFAIGLINMINNLIENLFKNTFNELFYIPFLLGIVISNIRVSFLTGING